MRVNAFLVLLVASFLGEALLLKDNESPESFEQDDDTQGEDDWQIQPKSVNDVPGLTENMLLEAINEAKKETDEVEKRTPRQNSQALQSHYRRFIPELEPKRIGAMIMERTTKRLASKLGLSHKEAAKTLEGLQSDHLKELHVDQENDPGRHVDEYRTIDGSGNNKVVGQRSWGKANTPFRRLLRPAYADSISKPRKAKNGGQLPNARKVSSVVFQDRNRPSVKMSHMAMTWGQFIDHDITLGAQPNVDCSRSCGFSGECFGIRIPANDLPFRSKGKTCIEMKRDVPAVVSGAVIRPREQVNVKSAFIDASQIYGDDPKVFKDLRLTGTPFLREMKNPAGRCFKNLLPKQTDHEFCQTTNVTTMPCFKAGDVRANENAGLGSMHTVWLREHNRIATELKKLNSHWNADKVFFEARKIVGAMIQHITYKEFLPRFLNYGTRRRFSLNLKRRGFYYGYRRHIDASISNAFATAAYRFGHTLVQNRMNRFGRYYKRITPHIPMNRFLDPTFLYQTDKGGVDSILRGLVKDRSQKVDRFFAKAVQEQLVRSAGDLADLPALNIQRGREHGVPGYNSYRRWTEPRKRKITSFRQAIKRRIFTRYQARILQKVYNHPDDIDLFVGGLYERPLRGAALGRTFSFILAEQFRRLRRGDRFWYENVHVFTAPQLREIRKVRLANVICRSSDGIRGIQPWVLAPVKNRWNRRNKQVSCWRLRKYSMNLKKWTDRLSSHVVNLGGGILSRK